jgi:hypothetical protein
VRPSERLAFLCGEKLAAQSSVSPSGGPQAAIVGIAVTPKFEIVFDTVDSSRKALNLRANPKIAFVIGGMRPGDERSVQYEGIADEPSGAELEQLKQVYFERHPEGRARQHWPKLRYFRVRPTWLRYGDYSSKPPATVELTAEQLLGE